MYSISSNIHAVTISPPTTSALITGLASHVKPLRVPLPPSLYDSGQSGYELSQTKGRDEEKPIYDIESFVVIDERGEGLLDSDDAMPTCLDPRAQRSIE
ncbi:hypothetical protein H0H93_008280 [Arthromyces matolae]|nr:hypothetical protein H0H93_008280 [Arthromyces matolae]